MKDDDLPMTLTPEERERIHTAPERELAIIYRERAIREYFEESKTPQPLKEPSPAEILLQEAVDWLSMQLAFLQYHGANGNNDAYALLGAILQLCIKNRIYHHSFPTKQPLPVKGRGRRKNPKTIFNHHKRSHKIHDEITNISPLNIPKNIPLDHALTNILDSLESQIKNAIRTDKVLPKENKKILDELLAKYESKFNASSTTLRREYLKRLRLFLIQDLAVFIFGEFLVRGGLLGIPKDRSLGVVS